MAYRAWFSCEDCGETYALTEIIYECRACGGLLGVDHDLDALARAHSADEWRAMFNERYRTTQWPFGSGVWGKKEWVCPEVADDNIVSMYEGGSNLLWGDRLGKSIGLSELWIKQCGNGHTGSFKDLGMTVLVSMVAEMRARGAAIPAVACASSGDTSAALAAYAAAADIPAIVFLPKGKVSPAQLIQPLSNGALTLALDTDFDGCMRLVKEITATENIYLANSMNSLRIEGQKTVGIEIVQQLDWEVPDFIIIPGGNLGNVSALGRGFLMMEHLGLIDTRPTIVVAQAEHANPLYLSYLTEFEEYEPVQAQPTLASAIQIGDPVSIKRAIKVLKEFNGIVEQASEDELVDAAVRADRTGLFCCPHTAVALAVLFKLVDRGMIRDPQRVVVVSTAHGLKFVDFKLRYHEGTLGEVECRHPNPPVTVAADAGVIRDTIHRHLEARAHAAA